MSDEYFDAESGAIITVSASNGHNARSHPSGPRSIGDGGNLSIPSAFAIQTLPEMREQSVDFHRLRLDQSKLVMSVLSYLQDLPRTSSKQRYAQARSIDERIAAWEAASIPSSLQYDEACGRLRSNNTGSYRTAAQALSSTPA